MSNLSKLTASEDQRAQRAQWLKIANACPMHKLLTGEVRIDTALD